MEWIVCTWNRWLRVASFNFITFDEWARSRDQNAIHSHAHNYERKTKWRKRERKKEQKIISVSQMKWENAKWRWRKWANKVLISAPIALNRYWICTKALYSIYDTNTYNRTQNTHNHTHTLSTRSVPFFFWCVCCRCCCCYRYFCSQNVPFFSIFLFLFLLLSFPLE